MALGLVGDNMSEIILTKIYIYLKVFNPKRAESNYFVPDLIFGKENCVKNGKSLLHAAAIPLKYFLRVWVDQGGKMIVDDE